MHQAMQRDPTAVRMHKELLLSLAKGDAETSSDVAALLAKRIKNAALSGLQEPPATPPSEPIPYSMESLDGATQTLSRVIEGGLDKPAAAISQNSPITKELTVTIIDSNFELAAAGEDDTVAEERDMKVLSQYLEADTAAWKAQKRAIARTLLEAARSSGISVEELLQSDVANGSAIPSRFIPYRECNVVVRCEVPPANVDEGAIEAQLAPLRSQPGWSAIAEDIARKEIELGHTSMRYKVGLHFSLESALGEDKCRHFVTSTMQALNSPSESGDVFSTLTVPTMPFTYMLRLCLWVQDPQSEPFGVSSLAATENIKK